MVTRARDLGWEALVVTIDAGPGRGREHNERNGYSFPFRPNVTAAVDMAMHPGWMWRVTRKYLKLIVKSILSGDQARAAVDAGAARAIKILADEMERAFGYVGARRISEIGPHIFAHHVSATAPATATPEAPSLRVASS